MTQLTQVFFGSWEPDLKDFCKGPPTMAGQQRKICFPEPQKCLFHHSVNTSLI